MPNDQALFWLCVVVLLGVALLLRQYPSVAITSTASILLLYKNSPTLLKRKAQAPQTGG